MKKTNKMKKMILNSIIFTSLLVFAVHAFSMPKLSIDKEAMYIQLSAKMLNADFTSHKIKTLADNKKNRFLTNVKLGAQLKNGLFMDESFDVINKEKLGILSDIGYSYKTKMLSPYAEVYYHYEPNFNKHKKKENFGYKAGLKLDVFNKFKPYIESDDITVKKLSLMKYGAEFKLNDKFAIEADYAGKSKESNNEVDFGIRYSI